MERQPRFTVYLYTLVWFYQHICFASCDFLVKIYQTTDVVGGYGSQPIHSFGPHLNTYTYYEQIEGEKKSRHFVLVIV